MSHTPGPWHIGSGNAEDWYEGNLTILCKSDKPNRLTGSPYRVLAKLNQYYSSPDNARLIAAAPELLEACIYAADVLEGEGGVDLDETINKLRAAIAKAEGR